MEEFIFLTLRLRNIGVPYLKRCKFFLLAVPLIAILVFFFWWKENLKPVSSESGIESTIVVTRGQNFSSVASALKKQSLIRNVLAFKMLAAVKGSSEKIQAGIFVLNSSYTSNQILEALTHGKTDVWLTFPEGLRKEEYAKLLSDKVVGFDDKLFLQLVSADEGYLFPDTYLIPESVTPQKMREMLLDNFSGKFTEEMESAASRIGFTKSEIVTLSSLVEREAKKKEDRPIVAGIIIKRLRSSWPLQIDATLQYALATKNCGNNIDCLWWPSVDAGDKSIASPYNSYENGGLPPGPICNPGLVSINSVINFEESPYWFYLSDKKGNIYYAKTIQEHNKNIQKYIIGND